MCGTPWKRTPGLRKSLSLYSDARHSCLVFGLTTIYFDYPLSKTKLMFVILRCASRCAHSDARSTDVKTLA